MSDLLYAFHQPHFVAGVGMEGSDSPAGNVDRTLASLIKGLSEPEKPGTGQKRPSALAHPQASVLWTRAGRSAKSQSSQRLSQRKIREISGHREPGRTCRMTMIPCHRSKSAEGEVHSGEQVSLLPGRPGPRGNRWAHCPLLTQPHFSSFLVFSELYHQVTFEGCAYERL